MFIVYKGVNTRNAKDVQLEEKEMPFPPTGTENRLKFPTKEHLSIQQDYLVFCADKRQTVLCKRYMPIRLALTRMAAWLVYHGFPKVIQYVR